MQAASLGGDVRGASGWRRHVSGCAAFALGLALLVASVRPAPGSTLDEHWAYFGLWALPAALLFGVAVRVWPKRARIVGGLVATGALVWAALAHPVCVAIAETEQPAFESVQPLADRAARGEPFRHLGGQWYQCKSVLARTFFF